MRIHFQDHAGFHQAVLQVTVACSALAGLAALAGAERFRPSTAVLAAAVATLALALPHLRLVLDPVGEALGRAAAGAEGPGRALLVRAAGAHQKIVGSAHDPNGPPDRDRQALVAAAAQATQALAEVFERRQNLTRHLRGTVPDDADAELTVLQRRRDATTDPAARDAYGRAAISLGERLTRVAALQSVVDRIDARLHATLAELESTALAVATRSELEAGNPPAALATACDRLRAVNAELGAECEVLTEVGTL